MTALRQRMIEDMQVQNLSPDTATAKRFSAMLPCILSLDAFGARTHPVGDSFDTSYGRIRPHDRVGVAGLSRREPEQLRGA